MDKEQVNERVKEIKRSFRLLMDGVASQAMRERGLGYKLNWGVALPHLKQMAKDIGKDYDLAAALWKEDVRECRILATMTMPAERMDAELASLWADQAGNTEIAEMAAANLFCDMPQAADMAFVWIASDDAIRQICGYNTLARLFGRGSEPQERDINELTDQALTAIQDTDKTVAMAAARCVNKMAMLGDSYQMIVDGAMKKLQYDCK